MKKLAVLLILVAISVAPIVSLNRGSSGAVASVSGASELSSSGGDVAVTADDTSAIQGALVPSGTLAYTNLNDTLSAAGTFSGATVTGTLARTELNDTLSAAGALRFLGTLARTEDSDTLAALGAMLPSGTVSVTEQGDTLVAVGIGGESAVFDGGTRPTLSLGIALF